MILLSKEICSNQYMLVKYAYMHNTMSHVCDSILREEPNASQTSTFGIVEPVAIAKTSNKLTGHDILHHLCSHLQQ